MTKTDFFTFFNGGEVKQLDNGNYSFTHSEFTEIEVVFDPSDEEMVVWGEDLTGSQGRKIKSLFIDYQFEQMEDTEREDVFLTHSEEWKMFY